MGAPFVRFVKQPHKRTWLSDASFEAVGGLCLETGVCWRYNLTEEERTRTVRRPNWVHRRPFRQSLAGIFGNFKLLAFPCHRFFYGPDPKTNYYGEYFERLFLSLTGISDAKNKNHPLWDRKSSLFLGSEIIEARNKRFWWFLSPEITALPPLRTRIILL